MARRRVVITGVGVVSGLGIGAAPFWDGLVSGRCAIARLGRFDPTGFNCRFASEVKDFSAREFVPKAYRKAVKVMARDIELAVVAAKAAVEDAGLTTRGTLPEDSGQATTYPNSRMGCQIGAGLIAAETEELAAALSTARRTNAGSDDPSGGFDLRAWGSEAGPDGVRGQGKMASLTPLWLLKYLPNMLACHVTIIHGCEGPSNTITCAEASGLLSIGESVRVIERGAADLCFSGGAESKLNFMGFLRLDLARRLAHTPDDALGEAIVRPYDPGAKGTVPGEAGGLVILEGQETAAARGARVYAEVVGFGAGQSPRSHQYTSCAPPGSVQGADEGLQLAIERALRDADVRPAQIDAIVPHAAGIPDLDRGEAGALREVFGQGLGRIPLVTLTPAIGECAAGHAGVLSAAGALCLRHQRLPARIHAGTPEPGLNAGAGASVAARLEHVLVCTSALGGQSAAIILRAA